MLVISIFPLRVPSPSSRLWGESRYAWSGVVGDTYLPNSNSSGPERYSGSSVGKNAALQTGGGDLQTHRAG